MSSRRVPGDEAVRHVFTRFVHAPSRRRTQATGLRRDLGGIPTTTGRLCWLTDPPGRPYKRSMDDDARRWNRVKQLFQDALERSVDERGPFVLAACGDDRELKGEVESLLVAHAAAGSFAQGPAIEALPPSAVHAFPNPSDIPSGANPSVPRHIGSYEVLSFLGAGGMGEVYRARDSRLGREVAIKVLPESFAQDPEHQARFEREAQDTGRAQPSSHRPRLRLRERTLVGVW